MNIGDAAKASGVSIKSIRHYESIGLMAKASRSDGGYRQYDENDVHILRFIKRSRGLGFNIREIKKLVSLWRNTNRASSEVKQMALSHVRTLETKIAELEDMAKTLRRLAKCCHGDNRPECPILEDLANPGSKS